jgi:DNA-binding CsgD family transcriptional regulator
MVRVLVSLTPKPPSVVEYAAGLPLGDIAKRHGVTPKTIRKRARLLGVAPRKKKVVGARARKAIALYRRGKSWKEISEMLDIDRTTLSEILKRNDVKLRTMP